MRLLVFAAAFVSFTAGAASPVTGQYEAVTESEFSLELRIEPKGKATFVFSSYEPGEENSEWQESWNGRWSVRDSILHINLGKRGYVDYRIDPCLPFQEFGHEGCGAGLKAITSDTEVSYGILRFGLWRAEALPK